MKQLSTHNKFLQISAGKAFSRSFGTAAADMEFFNNRTRKARDHLVAHKTFG